MEDNANTIDNYEVNILLDSLLDSPATNCESVNDTEDLNPLILPILEHKSKPNSLADILNRIQQTIDYGKINPFNIIRSDIFQCCIRANRRKKCIPSIKSQLNLATAKESQRGL